MTVVVVMMIPKQEAADAARHILPYLTTIVVYELKQDNKVPWQHPPLTNQG